MDRRTRYSAFAALLLACAATTTTACLWDYDTLQMERLRFPGVLEVITGKFVRHSKGYYEWRIQDRQKKLLAKPDDPALIDDLAVAHAKLGQPEKGIPLLEASLEKHPDRYETLSNLGTLLFFAGRLDESKEYLRRALKINPDAHFGREKYQLLLTEYVQQSELETKGVMSSEARSPHRDVPVGFAKYVEAQKFGSGDPQGSPLTKADISARRAEQKRAEKGVLGMMHFADFESPILLEALGDLLMAGTMEENRTHLAGRAYLRAEQGSTSESAKQVYREMAQDAASNLEEFEHGPDEGNAALAIERALKKELTAGQTFFAKIEADERKWIAEGRDVDREFAAVYYDSFERTLVAAEKQVRSEPKDFRLSKNQRDNRLMAIAAVVILVILAAVFYLIFAFLRWLLMLTGSSATNSDALPKEP